MDNELPLGRKNVDLNKPPRDGEARVLTTRGRATHLTRLQRDLDANNRAYAEFTITRGAWVATNRRINAALRRVGMSLPSSSLR